MQYLQYKGKPEPAPRPAPRDISLTDKRTSCGLIVKLVQGQYLQDEHEAMASGKQVKANSRLTALCPLPLNGVICVRGRLQCAPMFSDAIHRMVVPNEHPIAKLSIRHYHQALGHAGREHVLAELHQHDWILIPRALTRKVLQRCINCRKRF